MPLDINNLNLFSSEWPVSEANENSRRMCCTIPQLVADLSCMSETLSLFLKSFFLLNSQIIPDHYPRNCTHENTQLRRNWKHDGLRTSRGSKIQTFSLLCTCFGSSVTNLCHRSHSADVWDSTILEPLWVLPHENVRKDFGNERGMPRVVCWRYVEFFIPHWRYVRQDYDFLSRNFQGLMFCCFPQEQI